MSFFTMMTMLIFFFTENIDDNIIHLKVQYLISLFNREILMYQFQCDKS